MNQVSSLVFYLFSHFFPWFFFSCFSLLMHEIWPYNGWSLASRKLLIFFPKLWCKTNQMDQSKHANFQPNGPIFFLQLLAILDQWYWAINLTTWTNQNLQFSPMLPGQVRSKFVNFWLSQIKSNSWHNIRLSIKLISFT